MGSFPQGVNEDEIAELIAIVHQRGDLIFFDTAPHFLKWALQHGADIVSPNLDEAEAVLSGSSEDIFSGDGSNGEVRAKNAALALCALGATVAIVHAGALGSALAYKGETVFIPAADITVKSSVGAGDALAAGFILNCEEQGDLANLDLVDWKLALQYGSATAGAACELGRSGDVDPLRVRQIFERIVNSSN
jgi:fructose-1-phosphate kinase PfkB-like protein